MMIIVIVWLVVSLAAIPTALAGWRLYTEVRHERGATYMIAWMFSSAGYNAFMLILSIIALITLIRRGTDPNAGVNAMLLLFTLLNSAQAVSGALVGFFTIGVFRYGIRMADMSIMSHAIMVNGDKGNGAESAKGGSQ